MEVMLTYDVLENMIEDDEFDTRLSDGGDGRLEEARGSTACSLLSIGICKGVGPESC